MQFKIAEMVAAKPFTSDKGNTSLAKCKVLLFDGALILSGSVYSDKSGAVKSGVGREVTGTMADQIRTAILQSYASFKIPAPAKAQQAPAAVSQIPEIDPAMLAQFMAFQAMMAQQATPAAAAAVPVKKSKGVKLVSTTPEPAGF